MAGHLRDIFSSVGIGGELHILWKPALECGNGATLQQRFLYKNYGMVRQPALIKQLAAFDSVLLGVGRGIFGLDGRGRNVVPANEDFPYDERFAAYLYVCRKLNAGRSCILYQLAHAMAATASGKNAARSFAV